jgi:putative ABC transport system permease protein
MKWRRWKWTYWVDVFRRKQLERDLDEEIQAHIAFETQRRIERGLSPEAARTEAMREIRSVAAVKENTRDAWAWRSLESLMQDLRYAIRVLRKTWGVTTVAVLTLALGIGANAAIFSIVDAALLRPLPFPNPDRLVAIDSVKGASGPNNCCAVSPADFRDWNGESKTLQIAAFSGNGMTLRENDQTENIPSARVTERFFDVLGVRPMLGRTFTEGEWLATGPRAVVLSHRLWVRRFGSDPSVIGRRLNTGETVIGVMGANFTFPPNAEVWTPISRDTPEMNRRSTRYWLAIGRLRSGQSIDTAQAEMKTISGRLAASYSSDDSNWNAAVGPLNQSLMRNVRQSLIVLMGAVGLVLLISCANVSGLMLARSTARRGEVTIKLALGVGRRRLVGQFIIESLVLSTLGLAGGLLLAKWSIGALFTLLPSTSWTDLVFLRDEIHISVTVVVFSIVLSSLTGVVIALIPALSAMRITIANSIRNAAVRTQNRSENSLHKSLVVLQFACAVVLLAGAGLLVQSFVRMQHVEYGYDPARLALMPLLQNGPSRQVFIQPVMEKIKTTPGVESASVMSFTSFGGLNFPFNIEGRPLPGGDTPARYSSVGADYFRVLKARLVAGREFTEQDTANAPGVAIINETLAREYFQGEDPIGKKIVIAYLNQRVVREIIGVVSDIRQDQPREPIKPEVFVHWPQLPWLAAVLVVRTQGDPETMGKAIQQAIWSVDKTVPRSTLKTVESMLGDQVAEPRLYLTVLGAFAAAAVLLSMIGIYGMLSYVVSRRMNEMAIRIAIGAKSRDVLRTVVGEGMRLCIAGIGLGFVGAIALTRLMKNLLFGVAATDPLTLASVTLLLLAVAFVACCAPALRATQADPVAALRHE